MAKIFLHLVNIFKEDHLIFHYKTHTKLTFQPQAQLPSSKGGRDLRDMSDDPDKHKMDMQGKSFLSVPSRRAHLALSDSDSPTPKKRKKSTTPEVDDKKVKIEDKIGVKHI